MAYVKARTDFFARVAGRKVRVSKRDDPRRDDDPVVKAYPGMFRPAFDSVEDASAEPGTKRSIGRPAGLARAKPKTPKATGSAADSDTSD